MAARKARRSGLPGFARQFTSRAVPWPLAGQRGDLPGRFNATRWMPRIRRGVLRRRTSTRHRESEPSCTRWPTGAGRLERLRGRLATPLQPRARSPRSVDPALTAACAARRRTRRVKLGRFRRQVHGSPDFLGDGVALAEGEQSQSDHLMVGKPGLVGLGSWLG
jgi:hypothetical protein